MGSKVRITPRFIGTCILAIIGAGLIGGILWLTIGPENNVRVWLSEETLNSGDSLKLNVRNLGRRWIIFGYPYKLYKVYENGTIAEHEIWKNSEVQMAWPAVGIDLGPTGKWSQNIYSDYEPGTYYIVKQYRVEGTTYSKELYITIVG